jgi:hypothetical protein
MRIVCIWLGKAENHQCSASRYLHQVAANAMPDCALLADSLDLAARSEIAAFAQMGDATPSHKCLTYRQSKNFG